MVDHVKHLVESMFRHIGQTVTIFTTSGGLSGNGFTGVLLSADCHCVRLLADIGAPPVNYTTINNASTKTCFYLVYHDTQCFSSNHYVYS